MESPRAATSEVTSIPLRPGLNAIGYPIGGTGETSSFALLPLIGGPDEIERLLVFDAATGVLRATHYDANSQPAGDDVLVRFGDGMFVVAKVPITVSVVEPAACRPIDLVRGFNLKTLPCAAPGLTAFKLLRALGGTGGVANVERFNTTTGRFEHAVYDGDQPAGLDFPITAGDALLIGMRQSFNEWDVQVAGPDGATLEFSNGVVLEVPPGALASDVALSVSSLDCATVNPIVMAPAFSSLDKRCLTAFSAEPDGLQFTLPIVVTVPVPPLAAAEVPLWTFLDTQAANYEFARTSLVSLGDQGALQVEITHFSDHAAVAGKSKVEASGDPLPPECLQVPTPPGSCCTTIQVEVNAGDVLTGAQCDNCQIVGEQVEVRFINCPGSPQQRVEISETSGDCPTDLQASITPVDPTLWTCQTQTLDANMSGTNSTGGTCNFALPVKWELLPGAPSVTLEELDINQSRIRATDPVTATVRATSVADTDFTASISAEFVTLSGLWEETLLSGSETCVQDGQSTIEDEGPSQFNISVTQTCTATSNTVVVTSPDIPAAEPATGSLVETGNPTAPFSFTNLGVVGSSATPDCLTFFESNGQDIIFGNDPVCPPEGNECDPISCTETEWVSGTVADAATATLQGENHFQFNASWDELIPDPDTGVITRMRRSIQCVDNDDINLTARKL